MNIPRMFMDINIINVIYIFWIYFPYFEFGCSLDIQGSWFSLPDLPKTAAGGLCSHRCGDGKASVCLAIVASARRSRLETQWLRKWVLTMKWGISNNGNSYNGCIISRWILMDWWSSANMDHPVTTSPQGPPTYGDVVWRVATPSSLLHLRGWNRSTRGYTGNILRAICVRPKMRPLKCWKIMISNMGWFWDKTTALLVVTWIFAQESNGLLLLFSLLA